MPSTVVLTVAVAVSSPSGNVLTFAVVLQVPSGLTMAVTTTGVPDAPLTVMETRSPDVALVVVPLSVTLACSLPLMN